jgi:hypothetical protein
LINSQKHIANSFTLLLLIGGMVCLNAHRLTHITEEADSHQSTSAPDKNISDDCVLCNVSAFSFSDIESPQYIPDYYKSEIAASYSVLYLTEELSSVTVPRAPPIV